ncbi:fucolectin-5-like [Patiria miniata]|uniref:Apple domain-containing protein n=1 Tax=Patiria miniata TaxID=46514 RepID=A0A914AST0_PATMI|nr:fucolectin-5-like [Patiria miniata]
MSTVRCSFVSNLLLKMLMMISIILHSAHCELAAVYVTGKTAVQSTNFTDNVHYTADYAVDGNLYSSSHTHLPDPHPWWRLDLGTPHCLGRITVITRQGCCDQYRFTAALARAGLSPNYAENRPCGSPATRTESTTGATVDFPCDTPRMARYVTLDIDLASPDVTLPILQLAEVMVDEYTSGECTKNSNLAPKFESATFEVLHKNSLVANASPLATEVARSLALCAGYCMEHGQCFSFDYGSGKQCHLHNLNATYIGITPSEGSSVYVVLKFQSK